MFIYIYNLVYFISDKKMKTSFSTLCWTYQWYMPQNALLLFKQCFLFTDGDNKSAALLLTIPTCNGNSILIFVIEFLTCWYVTQNDLARLYSPVWSAQAWDDTLAVDSATSTALITSSTFLKKNHNFDTQWFQHYYKYLLCCWPLCTPSVTIFTLYGCCVWLQGTQSCNTLFELKY